MDAEGCISRAWDTSGEGGREVRTRYLDMLWVRRGFGTKAFGSGNSVGFLVVGNAAWIGQLGEPTQLWVS